MGTPRGEFLKVMLARQYSDTCLFSSCSISRLSRFLSKKQNVPRTFAFMKQKGSLFLGTQRTLNGSLSLSPSLVTCFSGTSFSAVVSPLGHLEGL